MNGVNAPLPVGGPGETWFVALCAPIAAGAAKASAANSAATMDRMET